MHISTPSKPVIHLGQLQQVQAEYLNLRRLGFTRAAIESHLCHLVLLDEQLIEEVEAVLTATAENPALPAVLTASR
jgi:hypothetical protein